MKTTLAFITLLISLILSPDKFLSADTSSYRVYKIDSINNYYLIYAKANHTLYKIVSKKEPTASSCKIKTGEKYKFKLHSIWNQDLFINGVNVSPRITPHITCLGFDSITSICIERPLINDLHYADNIRGLFYIKY